MISKETLTALITEGSKTLPPGTGLIVISVGDKDDVWEEVSFASNLGKAHTIQVLTYVLRRAIDKAESAPDAPAHEN